MRWRLGDILACPECGYLPLHVYALRSINLPPGKNAYIHPCDFYCARLDRVISESTELQEFPCDECRQEEIEEGIIFCPQCRRWFAILDGIPHLVRDGLRILEKEKELLTKYKADLPSDIAECGLSGSPYPTSISPSEEDKKILEEGKFWGEFFRAFVDTGDKSILDIRVRGTHPTFLNYGVLERDDTELYRTWGPWPEHLGNFLFKPIQEARGKRGLDIGCGGGQFGLEAAYQGVDMTGVDIAPEALSIARTYAREVGLDTQYIYADILNLPFRTQVFSLLMSKDSLHHLSNPEEAVRRLKPLLLPDALLIIIEHTGSSPFVKRIYDFFASRLVPKIQRRYKHTEIPPVLLQGAPNEDLGMDKVETTVKQHFHVVKERREWMLYLRLEQLFYFAFGKRRWLSTLVSKTTFMFERLCLLFSEPEHIAFISRNRK